MADRAEVTRLIRSVLAQVSLREPDDIQDDWTLMDLGIDSLTFSHIAATLEAEYGVELDEQTLMSLMLSRSVRELIDAAHSVSASA